MYIIGLFTIFKKVPNRLHRTTYSLGQTYFTKYLYEIQSQINIFLKLIVTKSNIVIKISSIIKKNKHKK